MHQAGSTATIFLARAWFSGPNWKPSIRACNSVSSLRASADLVLHSNRASASVAQAPVAAINATAKGTNVRLFISAPLRSWIWTAAPRTRLLANVYDRRADSFQL
jgi:hypothetical protein